MDPAPALVPGAADKLARMVAQLRALSAAGRPPVRLITQADHVDALAGTLRAMGAPEGSFTVEAGEAPRRLTPDEMIAKAQATIRSDDPLRRARAAHVAANVLLGQYRHNDPDAAARFRAERLAKRQARRTGA